MREQMDVNGIRKEVECFGPFIVLVYSCWLGELQQSSDDRYEWLLLLVTCGVKELIWGTELRTKYPNPTEQVSSVGRPRSILVDWAAAFEWWQVWVTASSRYLWSEGRNWTENKMPKSNWTSKQHELWTWIQCGDLKLNVISLRNMTTHAHYLNSNKGMLYP